MGLVYIFRNIGTGFTPSALPQLTAREATRWVPSSQAQKASPLEDVQLHLSGIDCDKRDDTSSHQCRFSGPNRVQTSHSRKVYWDLPPPPEQCSKLWIPVDSMDLFPVIRDQFSWTILFLLNKVGDKPNVLYQSCSTSSQFATLAENWPKFNQSISK